MPNLRRAFVVAPSAPCSGRYFGRLEQLVIYWLSTRRAAPGDGHPAQPSIAVLPLENLSADPEQEYFSDGLTDELITDLAKLRGLRVISRTSVLPYKRLRSRCRDCPTTRRELRCGGDDPPVRRPRADFHATDRRPAPNITCGPRRLSGTSATRWHCKPKLPRPLRARSISTSALRRNSGLVPPPIYRRRGAGRLSQRKIQLAHQAAGPTPEERGVFPAGYREGAGLCAGLCWAFRLLFRAIRASDRSRTKRTVGPGEAGGEESH